MDESIRDIYGQSDLDISLDSFSNAVGEKMEEYGDLVDRETAASLAVEELEKLAERTYHISDLHSDIQTVSVTAKIIAKTNPHSFEREDGSDGVVTNIELADESGRIRGVFWNAKTEAVTEYNRGDTLLIDKATVRENDGGIELHSTEHTSVSKANVSMSITFDTANIEDVQVGETPCLTGAIDYVGETQTFEKDDGTEGQVQNIAVEDDTGSLRISLWGDHADRDISTGDRMLLLDVTIQEGMGDEPEGSAGWNTTILTKDVDNSTQEESGDAQETAGDDQSSHSQTNHESEQPTNVSGNDIKVTGLVMERGDVVVLDTPDGEVTVETEESVTLGSTITVRGTKQDGIVEAATVL